MIADYKPLEHVVLTHENLQAVNTEEDQFNVAPVTKDDIQITEGTLKVTCPRQSWNMVRLGKP